MQRDDFEQLRTEDAGESSSRPEQQLRVMASQAEPVPAEVYEELLGRYERALVFAGQLQEKNRQALLLEEKSNKLEHRLDNLKKQVAVDEGYIRMLENALKALGILK